MKSVFGSSGRRFYELEFRTSSERHRAGEVQKVIVDQIELGRDSQCGIRFGEDCKTVSRRHAAIIKEGDGWKLVQLSKTNSTFLNGRKVENEWFLQNGDEIQLSTGGPRIGFLVKQGSGSLVKSINLTSRLSLFRQQALRPYKRAITALSVVLGLVIVGGTLSTVLLGKENRQLRADAEYSKGMIDSLTTEQRKLAEEVAQKDKTIKDLQSDVRKLKSRPVNPKPPQPQSVSDTSIKGLDQFVYYIEVVGYQVTLNGETAIHEAGTKVDDGVILPGGCGTGFLLDDGRFVTAHHVVEPWEFWHPIKEDPSAGNKGLWFLNLIHNNGGNVKAILVAIAPNGDQIQFTSSQFSCDRQTGYARVRYDDGDIATRAPLGSTDYAYAQVNRTQGLSKDATLSNNLKRGTQLTVLGYPGGDGVTYGKISPFFGQLTVSNDGLYEGCIFINNRNIEPGNSGGPVFYREASGNYKVVGIVSAGKGQTRGIITPISVIM